MTCWKKQTERKSKKYRKKSVVYPEKESKYIEKEKKFDINETIKCGGCNEWFELGSNDLKIHCNLCCQFFHCKIAGNCDGDACKITMKNGTQHRASYCYDCAGLISGDRILCKDCLLYTHLDKKL